MITPEPVAIFVPTLNRAHKLDQLIRNIQDATPEQHSLYFVIADTDNASNDVIVEAGQKYGADVHVFVDTPEQTDYRFPARVQLLYEQTEEPWFFTGADDINFHAGWLTRAFEEMEPHHCVATFNDLCNPKGTNFLVSRKYIQEQSGCMDVPNVVYHPTYKHNYSDDELVSTARYRGVFLKTSGIVEHYHPVVGKNPWDGTYERAQVEWGHDEQFYLSRTHLWDNKKYFGPHVPNYEE